MPRTAPLPQIHGCGPGSRGSQADRGRSQSQDTGAGPELEANIAANDARAARTRPVAPHHTS